MGDELLTNMLSILRASVKSNVKGTTRVQAVAAVWNVDITIVIHGWLVSKVVLVENSESSSFLPGRVSSLENMTLLGDRLEHLTCSVVTTVSNIWNSILAAVDLVSWVGGWEDMAGRVVVDVSNLSTKVLHEVSVQVNSSLEDGVVVLSRVHPDTLSF